MTALGCFKPWLTPPCTRQETVLLQEQQDGLLVVAMHQRGLLQVALALLVLLGKDVVVIRVLALHLARASKLESLLGAGFRLHLRHGLSVLIERSGREFRVFS